MRWGAAGGRACGGRWESAGGEVAPLLIWREWSGLDPPAAVHLADGCCCTPATPVAAEEYDTCCTESRAAGCCGFFFFNLK